VAHIRFQTYRLLGSRFQPDKGRLVRFELLNIAAVCLFKRTTAFLYSSCGFYRGSIFHVFTPTCISKIHLLLCLFLSLEWTDISILSISSRLDATLEAKVRERLITIRHSQQVITSLRRYDSNSAFIIRIGLLFFILHNFYWLTIGYYRSMRILNCEYMRPSSLCFSQTDRDQEPTVNIHSWYEFTAPEIRSSKDKCCILNPPFLPKNVDWSRCGWITSTLGNSPSDGAFSSSGEPYGLIILLFLTGDFFLFAPTHILCPLPYPSVTHTSCCLFCNCLVGRSSGGSFSSLDQPHRSPLMFTPAGDTFLPCFLPVNLRPLTRHFYNPFPFPRCLRIYCHITKFYLRIEPSACFVPICLSY